MSPHRLCLVLLAAAHHATGCGLSNLDSTPSPTVVLETNTGDLCIYGETTSGTDGSLVEVYNAGAPIDVMIIALLPAREDIENIHAACDIEQDRNELLVHSLFSATYVNNLPPPANHDVFYAACSSPPLAAGTYVIRHGEAQYGLTIPSTSSDHDTYEPEAVFDHHACFVPIHGRVGTPP